MAAKILEARAIVTGEDRTKAMWDSIMRRMGAVFTKAESLGKVTEVADRAIGRTSETIDRAGRGLNAAAERLDKAARTMERAAASVGRAGRAGETMPGGGHGRGGGRHGGHWIAAAENAGSERGLRHAIKAGGASVPGGGMGTTIAAIVAGDAAIQVAEKSADRQHERVRMDISGMSPAEREDAEKFAAQLSAKYRGIDQTAVMHTLRNARGITGSYEEAAGLSDDILKTRIVAQAAKPGQDVEADFDKLLKGMEEYGVTQDPKEFREAMHRVQKVLAVEGDTLSADSIYQSFKYTRQALPGVSQRFMLGTAPALAQEMGGASFGTSLSSFNRAIVSGRMDGRALQTALDLGLIDKSDVEMTKGKPTHVKPLTAGGHGFKDWKTAASDPDQWIWNTLDKAFKAKGITDPAEMKQVANTLFSSRTAGEFVSKILTQRGRIEKNQANLAAAPDDPAARIMAGDPTAAWAGVKNSFDNLAAAIPVSGGGVTGALNSLADVINDKAAALQGVTTDHARIAANRDKFGVASAVDLGSLSPDDLDATRRKALAEDDRSLVEKKLRIKGLHDEVARIDAENTRDHPWGFGGTETATKIAEIQRLKQEVTALAAAMERLKALAPVTDPRTLGINRAGVAAVPGFAHAAFPLGSTYGDVDPATGRNRGVAAPPDLGGPGGRLERAINPPGPYGSLGSGPAGAAPQITAELKGQADVKVSVTIEAGSELIRVAKQAATSSASGNFNVGTSMPQTAPGYYKGSGR